MKKNSTNITKTFILLSIFVTMIALITCSVASAATVTTDRLDYAPYEIVIITGSGWLPGEIVTIFLHEDPVIDPDVGPDSWLEPSPVADLDGNIYAEFIIQPNDIGVTFTLTATGLSSGLTAQTTFTDDPHPGATCPGNQILDVTCTTNYTGECVWGCRNSGADGGNCTANSAFAPNTTVCRPSAGVCDIAETCTGSSESCPVVDAKSTAVCRPAADICDVAESCDGVNNNCPADGYKAANTECRAANGLCDVAEVCTGTSASCPVDGYKGAGIECRGSAGDCDIAETCTGSSATCPSDAKKSAGTECRASAGLCDVAENCTGTSAACPADGYKTAGTECRAVDGLCDVAENCTGTSATCPADTFKPNTVVCNASAGVCDVEEKCTGSSASCPPDAFKPDTVVCRAAAPYCDVAEYCTGTSADCPGDLPAECSLVTSSSLCTFDIIDAIADNQFRLILTPDQIFSSANNNVTAWKLNASNPGQFYYNILYLGDGDETLTITLPYPFVTQGAMPIHIYDGVTITTDNGTTCFEPDNEITNSSAPVTLANYGNGMGSTTTVDVDLPLLSGRIAYINVHLDYGLKHTTGYSKDNSNNAVNAISPSTILIPELQPYNFSNSTSPGDMIQSKNEFKRDPGIAGLVLKSGSDEPVQNVKVRIYDSKNKLLATVYTDQDGWYMWQYKYTGKPATFTVALPNNNNMWQSVTLKSNGFVVVNFTLP